MLEVPEAETSFLSGSSLDDTYFQRIEGLEEASQPGERQSQEIGTIAELANTIDGYLDNPRTNRTILSNQIKRATRQIRRKYDNLQTDLINEQQRRYNAEAERDLRQTELRNTEADLNLMTTAYNGDENLEEFLAQFRAEIEARGIDIADAAANPAGRDILVAGRTAVQIGNQALNRANGQAGNVMIPLRAAADPWNEDWNIVGGRPTNDAVNAPNANNGQTVVVAGIRIDQAIWLLKTQSPPIEEEIRALIYGSLVQGDNSVEEFARRVKHAGKILGYGDEDLRRKFLDGLVPEWLEKAEDIVNKKESIPDPQKIINDALTQFKSELEKRDAELSKRDAEHKAEIEKLQQKSKKISPPIPPKNMEEINNGPLLEFLEIYKNRSDNIKKTHNDRIGRIEEGLNETRGAMNQLTEEFQKPNIRKANDEDKEEGYNEEENIWYESSESGAHSMRKMCQSHTVREEESKLDEWFSSLQYLNAKIDNISISNSFLDPGSEFGALNDATINVLGWKADKPSNFDIKGNSKHVTTIGNFTRIDNGESEPMLCLGMTWIRKVQGILDPNKNQFRMK
ncbi:12019_t:CDS:2 [Acaulospora colombiana]|uniref:12019_t:CDS:1 n=1 Tax=Acaulospora colombiana TaxID=27376 RepID=A0ACA9KM90_9GLOM|nr:12019_t:CDS:2 [Acaulospora colombiana]